MGYRVNSTNYKIWHSEHTNYKDITEEKIDSIKKIIQNWLHRNITPKGRMCITKSLIMSKIIHILQTLLTPHLDYFKKLDKIFLGFIRKNKRHEISKELLCENIENSRLKMINLSNMDMSLKITWLRTIDKKPRMDSISSNIDRLATTDIDYHMKLYKNTHNPSWKSVILAYKNWYTILKETIQIKPEDQPIWGNQMIKIPFNESLFSKR